MEPDKTQSNARHVSVELLVGLARAIQMMRVYQEEHTLVEQALSQLSDLISRLLEEREAFVVGLIGDELIFEEGPLPPSEKRFTGLINLFKAFSIQKIRFMKGLSRDELRRFVKLLAMPPRHVKQGQSFQARFDASGFRFVALGGFGVPRPRSPMAEDDIPHDQTIREEYQEGARFLAQAFRDLKGSPAMNVQSARQIVDGLLNNIVRNKNLLPLLTSMRAYDEEMFEHGVNVSVFTLLQAEMLGIEEKYLADVGMAALLHDIGHISETGEEAEGEETVQNKAVREAVRQRKRDVQGAKILLDSEGIPRLAAIVAFENHMRYDMKGLPRKLYGKELNMVSMMIAISDYYDKLRKRPEFYEEGGPEKAYQKMISLSGTYFQPDLLENFFSVIGVYPPGTLVELDTGEVGMVIQGNVMDIRRPQIEILYDASGRKHDAPQIVNLIERDSLGQFRRRIVKSISIAERFGKHEAKP